MLIKEVITKVARELKNEEIKTTDDSLLEGYPEDLTREDIAKAMSIISVVSDSIIDLY
tara:strand:+ start:1272 stop:1445 length:174 start_codon:yes stop_codon:yes gene_type:complete